jgi:hypothetical protein
VLDAIGRTTRLVAGLLMLGAAVIHGFINVPHLYGDLAELRVRSSLLDAVMLVMSFSVVAMFAFAGLVLSDALGVPRRQPARVLWIIAGAYVVFGIVGYVSVSPSPHMLGYSVMGLVLALGVGASRSIDGALPGGG